MEEPNEETATTTTASQLIVDKMYNELQNVFLQKIEELLLKPPESEGNILKFLSQEVPYVFLFDKITEVIRPKKSDAIVCFYNHSNQTQYFTLSIGGSSNQGFVIEPKSVVYPFDGNYPINLLALCYEEIRVEIQKNDDKDENRETKLYEIHCFIIDRKERLQMCQKQTFTYSNKKVVLNNGQLFEETIEEYAFK